MLYSDSIYMLLKAHCSTEEEELIPTLRIILKYGVEEQEFISIFGGFYKWFMRVSMSHLMRLDGMLSFGWCAPLPEITKKW